MTQPFTISSLQELPAHDPGHWGHNGYVTDRIYHVTRQTNETGISFELTLTTLPTPFTKTWANSEADIAAYAGLLKEGHSFGAYDGNRMVGMVLCAAREWNNTLHIENILVAASHRRKGIRRTLIKKVIDHATHHTFRLVTLETQNTNVPAITFYQQQGFILDGIQLSLYDPLEYIGEIALFMAYEFLSQE